MLVPEMSVEKMIADQIKYFEGFEVLDNPIVFMNIQDINPQILRYDMGYNVGPLYVRGNFTVISSGLNIGHYEYISPHEDHVDVFLDGDGCVCSVGENNVPVKEYNQILGMPIFASPKVLIDYIKARDLHFNLMKFKSVAMRHQITR